MFCHSSSLYSDHSRLCSVASRISRRFFNVELSTRSPHEAGHTSPMDAGLELKAVSYLGVAIKASNSKGIAPEGNAKAPVPCTFNAEAARAFLTNRWDVVSKSHDGCHEADEEPKLYYPPMDGQCRPFGAVNLLQELMKAEALTSRGKEPAGKMDFRRVLTENGSHSKQNVTGLGG